MTEKNVSLCTKNKYHNDPKPWKYLPKTILSYLQSQNDQFFFFKKSLHPETLKPQTINDTWVFLALYLTV